MKHKKMKKRSKKNDYITPVIVSLVTLIALVGIALLIRAPATGQASFQVPISGSTLNLDLEQVTAINTSITTNDVLALQMVLSGDTTPTNLKVKIVEMKDGALQYILVTQSAPDFSDDPLALGIISSEFTSSSGIFVNNDKFADLQFNWNAGMFEIENLRYVTPDVAKFTLFNSSQIFTDDVVYVTVGQPHSFKINVTSSYTPGSVTAKLNGQVLAVPVFDVPISGSDYKQAEFEFTPTQAIPYKLELEATVGTQVSTTTYLFAGNGVVKEINEVGFPGMKMFLEPGDNMNNLILNLTFTNTLEKQPFSLPCDVSMGIHSLPVTVYTYEGRILGSDPTAPASEINRIEDKKGYVLKLQDGTKKYPITIPGCSLVQRELPELNIGWNFIGVKGYEDVTILDLTDQLPTGAGIGGVFELSQGELTTTVSALEPGKAYWVFVE
jgi:hypothetical protein